MKIVVGGGVNATDSIVCSGRKTLTTAYEGISEAFTFTGSDYNVPKGDGFLIYTVFVRNITGSSESDVVRVELEGFNVIGAGN
ncbi:hypothetical protein NIZ91_07630 [Bacillus sp. 1780r2a1]|uniref:hypothetical protein n=1 Tax=Priestia flexa TaxID=86664 RepID=UPI0021FA8128|nr:hypothetical protein [Priestia flexa]MDT2047357.1 hypothetical protein [Priestia flexa]USY56515.1 hypothetical protein NIZ91_07630 [Bacillus sp. 1780r2a1]